MYEQIVFSMMYKISRCHKTTFSQYSPTLNIFKTFLWSKCNMELIKHVEFTPYSRSGQMLFCTLPCSFIHINQPTISVKSLPKYFSRNHPHGKIHTLEKYMYSLGSHNLKCLLFSILSIHTRDLVSFTVYIRQYLGTQDIGIQLAHFCYECTPLFHISVC